MRELLRSVKTSLMLIPFRAAHRGRPEFECPICGYHGPFATKKVLTGDRPHARCPKCGGLERHRIQRLVLESLFRRRDPSRMRMLHFAPERVLAGWFRGRFGSYATADLFMPGVDHRADLRSLPFADASFDFVFASHVLEHVNEDAKAISEIRRILAPGGIAVLPVPVVAFTTIEYPEPNPHEEYHVRAPGPDYFDRYAPRFSTVEIHRSSDFPDKNQCHIYEDRTRWPRPEFPLLPAQSGTRHEEYVPICFAGQVA